ncbi:RNA polymerase recycling motor HelD [Paenibacillus antri]|nr:RNA polymerase recycling motor HelD [Paenibacillus antri]
MSLPEEELRREERRLETVLERVEREIEESRVTAGGRKEQLVGGKRELWEDLVYDTDDWFEAAVQLTQQAQELSQHATSYRLAQGRSEHLQRLLSNPYFARFDFRETGSETDEPIYLGTMSIADEETHEVIVYDWRAPVAGMYYDYGPGPASYDAPDGKVTGEMTLKRQFVIRGGKLLAAFDTGVTIGDEMLQRMLGQGADDKMKSIVTTIQREQNRIIRETDHRFVFVQGAAGSGKTSAALQRVAYLLYKYRNYWEPEQVVLFSPNDVFNDYVSNVLPELGEDAIPQTTFYDYVWRRLRHVGDVEHPYDQLEYLLSSPEASDPRREGIRVKASLAFAERIDAYAKTLAERGVVFRSLTRKDKTVFDAAELEAMFYVEFAKQRPPHRLESMKERLLERLKELERKRAVALYRKWLKEPNYLGTEQELKRLGLAKAKKAYAPLREQVAAYAFLDVVGTYRRLLADIDAGGASFPVRAAEWGAIVRDTNDRLDASAALPYEDAVPMLYLLEALHGASRMNRVRHVVVDEAQDYTPLQWAYLRRLFPNAGVTAVGDANQAIHGVELEGGHMASAKAFPAEETVEIRLKKSYRSTRQIVAFASAMLPDAAENEPFERDGPPPDVTVVPEAAGESDFGRLAAERIRKLLAEGSGSIAVVAKTAKAAEDAYRQLAAQGVSASRLTKETKTFPSGIVVLPSYLAKGLEFDAVVVWDAGAGAYARESERKLLYTVCTRALHRLVVLAKGEPSPFLRDVPERLYASSR